MKRFFSLLIIIVLFSCTGAEPEEEVAPAEISDSSDELVFKSAVTDTTGNIGAEAGFIADGDKITLPTGFTAEQCVFTAALASVSGSALSQRVAVNKTTAVVTCKTLVQERAEVQPTEKSCTASYTVICAK